MRDVWIWFSWCPVDKVREFVVMGFVLFVERGDFFVRFVFFVRNVERFSPICDVVCTSSFVSKVLCILFDFFVSLEDLDSANCCRCGDFVCF